MQKVLNKREKLIFICTVSVIVFALIFNFIISPVLNKNDDLNKDISIARAKIRKYLWLLSQKNEIEKKYSKFSSVAAKDSEKNQDALVEALSELESLAQGSGIKIIDIRPKTSSDGASLYKEIPIDLRTEGSVENYLKFIYNLENSFSLLKIKEYQLSTRPNSQFLEGIFSIHQLSAD